MSPDGMASSLPGDALDTLKNIVGPKGYIDNNTDGAPYLTDWRGQYRGRCALILRPDTTSQVSDIVKVCAEHHIIIVPQGGNTGMNGAATPSPDGDSILLSLGRMNRIRKIDTLNYTAIVEAGCILQTIQEAAEEAGRLFPLSLGAEGSCQIGGNLATNAGGVSVLRYGNMRDLVLGLEVVLPSGDIWNGLKTLRKDNTGYDLKHLFVGSEGTLGVITEVTLRLYGIPEAISAAVAGFPDLESAVNTVILTIQSGIPVARIELLDEVQMDACNRYSDLDYPVRPTLFFEFHGSDKGVVEQVEAVEAIAGEFGADDFRWATKAEDRNKLWQARHDAYYACLA
ncbi:MAG: FAD-binding oxidoreductase, partial [Proteobacteria bacterium]|nr:FAD-binding oxidoreductase [Pseudomonadota bacterium]